MNCFDFGLLVVLSLQSSGMRRDVLLRVVISPVFLFTVACSLHHFPNSGGCSKYNRVLPVNPSRLQSRVRNNFIAKGPRYVDFAAH